MARPTKYGPDMQAFADEYLTRCASIAHDFPSVEGMAEFLQLDTDTIVEWAQITYPNDYEDEDLRGQLKYPKFTATYKRLKALQRKRLMHKGLENSWNNAMAIFLLKANHGMIETSRQEVDQKTEHSGGITVNVTKYGGGDDGEKP